MINNALNLLRRIKHAATPGVKGYLLGTSSPSVGLIVIGAQKSGTTSLYKYLSEHPDIDVPLAKELDYFNSLGARVPTMEEYKTHFPTRYRRNTQFTSIDVSPSYLLDAATTAQNIHTLYPKAKIVVILREPVERAVSSWFMYKKYYRSQPRWFFDADWVRNSTNLTLKISTRSTSFGADFSADIEEEIEVLKSGGRIEYPIVEFGHYKTQLKYYLELFERDNILVFDSQEFKQSTQDCLNKITTLMELKAHDLESHQLVPHFVGDNKQPIVPAVLDRLTEYYQEQNKGLEELLGRDLYWMRAR